MKNVIEIFLCWFDLLSWNLKLIARVLKVSECLSFWYKLEFSPSTFHLSDALESGIIHANLSESKI